MRLEEAVGGLDEDSGAGQDGVEVYPLDGGVGAFAGGSVVEGRNTGGIEDGNPPFEDGASQRDMDY